MYDFSGKQGIYILRVQTWKQIIIHMTDFYNNFKHGSPLLPRSLHCFAVSGKCRHSHCTCQCNVKSNSNQHTLDI